MNVTVLQGRLVGSPRLTELGEGRSVLNFEVATHHAEGRQVAPVAWFDPPARPRLSEGDDIVVVGAVRRRWFRAGGASQSRTEVVAERVVRAGSARAKSWVASVGAVFSGGPATQPDPPQARSRD